MRKPFFVLNNYILDTLFHLIRDCRIITIDDLNFVFISKDFNRLTEEHMSTLHELLHVEGLYNPVYVSIEPDGVLLVD